MTNQNKQEPFARLFVSYSHRDVAYREAMETNLALILEDDGVQEWSDQEILAGQSLSSVIREHMDKSNVFVFLLSPDFIASKYCKWEWEYAAQLEKDGKKIFRIPIILRTCPWRDMMGDDDVKALPDDGQPISLFQDVDFGWGQIYEGIKAVVEHIKETHAPNQDFLAMLNKTDFLSQSHINLNDIFVFLRLTCQDPRRNEQHSQSNVIQDEQELLAVNYALIHGPQNAGKTALMRRLFLTLVDQRESVLYIDGEELPDRSYESVLRRAYAEQFEGDYDMWSGLSHKTLVLDNLTAKPRLLNFVAWASTVFERIYVSTSTEVYLAFFQGESRLAGFSPMHMEPLTQWQQEQLIRRRLALADRRVPVTDGYVDQIEKEVNSIILSERIFPRYPFFVLSILQSHETYMPDNMAITSFGYCYHVLIIAALLKSDIRETSGDVGAAFNFAEHLAFARYNFEEREVSGEFNFGEFIDGYEGQFHIEPRIINRLKDQQYGLIDDQGCFRNKYVRYYFLARYLTRDNAETRRIISNMCEQSHREVNYLTLLFVIHHTDEDSIIDDILVRTMCSLDHVEPAKLDSDETGRFASIIAKLPENILADGAVEQARQSERELRQQLMDRGEELDQAAIDDTDDLNDMENPINSVYRIYRNNRIMAQVLRNKHGRLERSKIEDIIAIIADGGLRLINIVLEDEERITKFAMLLHERNSNWDLEEVKNALKYVFFMWTVSNIEDIVSAVNVRETRTSVRAVVNRNRTPAYDLIGYFNQLDVANELTEPIRNRLRSLLREHDDAVIARLLSLRTQHYLNTHRSPTPVEQSVCRLLGIGHLPYALREPKQQVV